MFQSFVQIFDFFSEELAYFGNNDNNVRINSILIQFTKVQMGMMIDNDNIISDHNKQLLLQFSLKLFTILYRCFIIITWLTEMFAPPCLSSTCLISPQFSSDMAKFKQNTSSRLGSSYANRSRKPVHKKVKLSISANKMRKAIKYVTQITYASSKTCFQESLQNLKTIIKNLSDQEFQIGQACSQKVNLSISADNYGII